MFLDIIDSVVSRGQEKVGRLAVVKIRIMKTKSFLQSLHRNPLAWLDKYIDGAAPHLFLAGEYTVSTEPY